MNVNGSNAMTERNAKKAMTLEGMVGRIDIRERFQKMLGAKTAGFLSSVLALASGNSLLKKADPVSVLSAAAIAASLDLPVNPSLGKAYIVPYRNKMGVQTAQFQIGYRGLIELAQRSGQMRSIVMTPVYEGEIARWDRFTETYTEGAKISEKVVGYYASFELLNGFSKAVYWTREEVTRHALRFNQSCKRAGKLADIWASDFDAMACKTVLASIIRTYAPLSIEIQDAMTSDGASFEPDGREMMPEAEDVPFTVEAAEDAEAVPAEAPDPAAEDMPEEAETKEGPQNGAALF